VEGTVNVYEKNLGISPQTLSDNIENVVGIERTSVVMPAVVEPAPAVVGRGGHLSSKYQDRLSIKNVENDERGLIYRKDEDNRSLLPRKDRGEAFSLANSPCSPCIRHWLRGDI